MSIARVRLVFFAIFLSAAPIPAPAALRINEFLAINDLGEPDKDGDASDWIEIRNSSNSGIDLTGWFLTDDADNLTKWRIPKGTVPPTGYALIFASGKDFSSLFNPEIHANFSLNGDGEYLALVEADGLSVAHPFEPGYPEQRRDVSYGFNEDGEELGYFSSPTPGEANGKASEGLVAEVQFSVTRGFHDEPFSLELSTETEGATIRYTTNGKVPSLFNAATYAGPIPIDTITTIRAHALKDGFITSELETHTYLFAADVAAQETMSTRVTEDSVYGPLIVDALLEHPSISLVTPVDAISQTSEDPTSVELILPDGSEGFQIDAGVKRVGGHSLNAYPKNNMRLYFRSEYGKEKLRFPLFEGHPFTDVAADEFDQLNLRSGSHDSVFYLGADQQSDSQAQYLRNRWINDMQFIMGHESLRGRWAHLYINGIYWGHYHLLERPTQDYFASYLGGKSDDYVAVNKGLGVGSSDMTAWDAMRTSAGDYAEFQRWVDLENYVDYMLLHYYCGNDWDWNPEQNWAGGGPVTPDSGGMKFIAWDSDIIFGGLRDNNLSKPGPHSMFPRLMNDPEFAIYVADRIQKHFYNDGLLTPEPVAEVYNFRAEQIRLSIVPETARWQNGRWTRDNQWQRELDRINNEFFPNRTEVVLDQFKTRGWTGAVAAPGMEPLGGHVESGLDVKLTKSLFARGTIVYTTDGTDPRLPGGERAPQALDYQGGIPLTETTVIKARITNSDGWSAFVEARFAVDQVPPTAENLTVSKIHYHPAAASATEIEAGFPSRGDFEFLELLNLSEDTIDLSGLRLSDGVYFEFADASIIHLDPGQRLFLVKNTEAFVMRYGSGLPVAGNFTGSLSNDGERLEIVDESNQVIQDLIYNDREPWPEEADGKGRYLVLKTTQKAGPDNPEQWRASQEGEMPGADREIDPPANPDGLTYDAWNLTVFINGEDDDPSADPDGDRYPNLAEFVFGSDPLRSDDQPLFRVISGPDGTTLATEMASQRSGIHVILQTSPDLTSWQDLDLESLEVSQTPHDGNALDSVTYRGLPDAPTRYLRFQATLAP